MRVAIASPLRVPLGSSPNATRTGSMLHGGHAARSAIFGDDGTSARSATGSL